MHARMMEERGAVAAGALAEVRALRMAWAFQMAWVLKAAAALMRGLGTMTVPARAAALALALLAPLAVLAPQAARAQTPGPDSIVRLLYQHYIDTTDGLVFAFDYTDPVVASNYFDPILARLLVEDSKSDEPQLDFDPFVDAQDFDIKTVDLQTRMLADDTAEITARFKNVGEDEMRVFTVVRTDRGWRIADVRGEDKDQSLRTFLSGAS